MFDYDWHLNDVIRTTSAQSDVLAWQMERDADNFSPDDLEEKR